MIDDIFSEWIKNTFVPSLKVFLSFKIDNASYYNAVSQEAKLSTSSGSKNATELWLTKEHMQLNEMYMKPELLSLVKQAQKVKLFHIVKITMEHRCLRLPPYHSHLNRMEMVWATMKENVAYENKTFKLCDVKQVAYDPLSKIDQSYFALCDDHIL